MSNCLQLDHVDYAYGAAKSVFFRMSARISNPGRCMRSPRPVRRRQEHAAVAAGRPGRPLPGSGPLRREDIAASGYAKHRREHVSLVFQDHNLIDYLTPEENLRLVSAKADMKILEELGLSREESSATSCTCRAASVNRWRSAARWSPRAARSSRTGRRAASTGDDRRGDSSAAARRPSARQMRDRGDAFQARRQLRRCRAASREQETDPGMTHLGRAAPRRRPAWNHRHNDACDPWTETAPPIIESGLLQSNNRGAVQKALFLCRITNRASHRLPL